MRIRAAYQNKFMQSNTFLQHKSLLLFAIKKVIVVKIKLCSNIG